MNAWKQPKQTASWRGHAEDTIPNGADFMAAAKEALQDLFDRFLTVAGEHEPEEFTRALFAEAWKLEEEWLHKSYRNGKRTR